MTGTNPVSDYAQTNFTTDTGTAYKTKIDKNFIVAQRLVDNFAPRQTSTPAMTVTLDAGHIFAGTTLTEVASQVTGTITAPIGNPRIDRVVIDRLTGVLSVITGTPAASPAAPAITAGKSPVCQVLLQTTSSTITNAMITDERDFSGLGHGTASEYNVGTAANNILQLNGTAKIPAVDGSLLTGIGTVGTTGTPASGKLAKFSSATTVTNGDLTGDVTTSGAMATTLATVNSSPGTYTNATLTVDAKGRVTSASSGTGGVMTPLAVGSLITATYTTAGAIAVGTSVAAATLVPMQSSLSSGAWITTTDTLSGTWLALQGNGGNGTQVTLFQRTA